METESRWNKAKTPAKRRKGIIGTILLVVVFMVGVGVLLYPSVSEWWNARVQTRAVAAYDAAVVQMDEKDYDAYFDAADRYNRALADMGSANAITRPEQPEGYEDLLNVGGAGIMGYVTIDVIDVQLPIYHGTDASVLQVGAGHMQGTSLPVGGESTHSVISAHTGLPSALLFTHLDRLTEGDVFTITILNRVLTYQVDQILTVLPTEIENLYIEQGKDYCTLMTCTPYGINSHRLLVRGSRIYPEEETEETIALPEETETEPKEIPNWTKWAALGVGVLVVIWLLSDVLVRIIWAMRKRKKK
ncbi:MAG: class C sortase [Clostridiales bacterium]|nr:class C sortase [Clostridiales bacterium]